MWLGWACIDESELVQQDFFGLCELARPYSDSGVESHANNGGNNGEKVQYSNDESPGKPQPLRFGGLDTKTEVGHEVEIP